MGAYLTHEIGETLDLAEQGRVVQILKDLLPIAHGTGIAERVEQHAGDQIMLLTVTRDRCHDLVEVQIRREGAILVLLPDSRSRLRLLKQQT